MSLNACLKEICQVLRRPLVLAIVSSMLLPTANMATADTVESSRRMSTDERSVIVDFAAQPGTEPDEDEPPVEPSDDDAPSPAAPPFAALSLIGLASVPNMFGDFLAPSGHLVFGDPRTGLNEGFFATDIPSGALRRAKIGDNNKALPMDRVYFTYNHFHNAIDTLSMPPEFPDEEPELEPVLFPGPPGSVLRRRSLDRYVVGAEKTFLDGHMSVELRVPFLSPVDLNFDPLARIPGQDFGNINVAIKALLHRSDNFAVAAGVGIDLPTGDDINAMIAPPFFPPFGFRIKNETVFFQPFLAMLATPGENSFVHGFLAMDVAGGSDPVQIAPIPGPPMQVGELTSPTLLHLDVAYGHWLYRGDGLGPITGIAGVAEFHYTTMLSDPDMLFVVPPGAFSPITLGSVHGRQDFIDITGGLHMEIGENTTLRIGGVAPGHQRPDRTFDAEFFVHLNHYFGDRSGVPRY